jgi:hypothetical protein
MTTPIRWALREGSTLQARVANGLSAVNRRHARDYLADDVRALFLDSLDLDAALQPAYASDHRWDYLLGHDRVSRVVIGLEPHTANNHEVSTVIAKRNAALMQLRDHLRPGAKVTQWFWVASGRVDFAPLERASLALSQEGITFVGRRLSASHLDPYSQRRPRRRRLGRRAR